METTTRRHVLSRNDRGPARRFGWRAGLAFYAGVQATSFGLGLLAKRAKGLTRPGPADSLVGNDAYNAYYNGLRQPVFAPPDRAFAPVWTVNNALQIWGLLHALNLPPETPGRTAFLRLQAGFWASFIAFNPLYFGLRSPVLGAAVTQTGLALTTASAGVAAAQMRDRKALLSLSTVWPWLLIAGATSTAMALWNRDDFLAAGPFVEPSPGWVKPGTGKEAADQSASLPAPQQGNGEVGEELGERQDAGVAA